MFKLIVIEFTWLATFIYNDCLLYCFIDFRNSSTIINMWNVCMLRWTIWMCRVRLFSQSDIFSFNAIFFRARLNFKFVTTITITLANILENLIDITFENITIVDFTIEFVNNELVNDALTINAFKNDIFQTKLINRIRWIYLNNIILQRIMKTKRKIFKRVLIEIIKNEIKFEFENYKIKKNFF